MCPTNALIWLIAVSNRIQWTPDDIAPLHGASFPSFRHIRMEMLGLLSVRGGKELPGHRLVFSAEMTGQGHDVLVYFPCCRLFM